MCAKVNRRISTSTFSSFRLNFCSSASASPSSRICRQNSLLSGAAGSSASTAVVLFICFSDEVNHLNHLGHRRCHGKFMDFAPGTWPLKYSVRFIPFTFGLPSGILCAPHCAHLTIPDTRLNIGLSQQGESGRSVTSPSAVKVAAH